MIEITQEKVDVLSKLYNLRGEDSIVLDRIKREIDSIESTKEKVTENKIEEEDLKKSKEEELENFNKDEEKAFKDFSAFEENSYDALSAIGVSFDIKKQLTLLREEGKKYKDNLSAEISDAIDKISSLVNEIASLESDLEEQNEKLEEERKTQEKLNALLEDILVRQNDSYNRGYVRKLLEEVAIFDEEEITILEMLILFPETGLSHYEDQIKNKKPIRVKKTAKENTPKQESAPKVEKVVEEIESVASVKEEVKQPIEKETVKEVPIIEEKPIMTEPISFHFDEESSVSPFQENKEPVINFPFEEETPISLDEIKIEEEKPLIPDTPIIESSIIKEPIMQASPQIEEIVPITPPQANPLDSALEQYLITLGLDLSTNKETILTALNNVDKKTIEDNKRLLVDELEINKSNNVLYTIIDGDFYLKDSDLIAKVNFLRSKGINDKIIREEIENKNFTCSLKDLKERIALLEEENSNIASSLYLVKHDIKMYRKNVKELEQAGIALDEKEKVNYRYLLSLKDISPLIKVLKEYLIMIRKTNGKLALNVLNKGAKELSLELDKLLETELDELITNYPEVLSQKADNIIKRVLYCITNNIEIKTNSNSYMKYIYDAQAFAELVKNRNDSVDIELFDERKVNEAIKTIVENNQEIPKLVDILNNYYNKKEFEKIELNVTQEEIYKVLIEHAPSILKATSENNGRIYKVCDKAISTNKVHRNIRIILANSDTTDEKAIVLVSALYNLLTDNETIANITETCLTTGEEKVSQGGATE